LHAEHGHDRQQKGHIPRQHGGDAQRGQRDLGDFAAHDDRAFAEPIRQIPGRSGQDQIRQHEARGAGHQDQTDVFFIAGFLQHLFAQANRQPAKRVVVDRR